MQVSANLHPYWLLLKDLSMEQKLSLIELLVQSVKAKNAQNDDMQKSDDDWVQKYNGCFSEFPESAEEMIELIEESKKTQASQRLEKLRHFAGDAKFPDSTTSKNDVYKQ
jgi:hypothetical protein